MSSPRNLSPDQSQEKDVLNARGRRLMFAFTVTAVCFRVDIFRRILGYRQCTTPGIEVSYAKTSSPFLVADGGDRDYCPYSLLSMITGAVEIRL